MAELTVAAFRARFPEFDPGTSGRGASDALVQAKIDEAVSLMSEAAFGVSYLTALGYRTAMLLAAANRGQPARLQPANARVGPDDALTTYEREYIKIARSVPGSPVVSAG